MKQEVKLQKKGQYICIYFFSFDVKWLFLFVELAGPKIKSKQHPDNNIYTSDERQIKI